MKYYKIWKELTATGPWITEKSTDTQYRVIREGDEVRIHFQAVGSFKDWVMVFMFWHRFTNFFTTAHAGILRKWVSIGNDVTMHVSDPAVNRITLYGYSKGGAMATLAYYYFKMYWTEKEVSAVIFGSPRVIGMDFSKTDTTDLVRIEVSGDPVCKLPPRFLLFKHVGSRIRMGKWRLPLPKYHSHRLYEEKLKEQDL